MACQMLSLKHNKHIYVYTGNLEKREQKESVRDKVKRVKNWKNIDDHWL